MSVRAHTKWLCGHQNHRSSSHEQCRMLEQHSWGIPIILFPNVRLSKSSKVTAKGSNRAPDVRAVLIRT